MNIAMHAKLQLLEKTFANRFGERPHKIVVRSPGRINLIGEHTDYNDGYVLPAAIDKNMLFLVAPRGDQECYFLAADLQDEHHCSLSALRKSSKNWPNYLMGVLQQILNAGRELRGCEVVFGGDVPIGAGLSSSAALEAGFAFALNTLFPLGFDRLQLARLAQKAEHEFAGVQCGLMDQFSNIFGQEKKVLKLDCRSLEYDYFPFEREDVRFVLCDTGVRRSLAGSEYNIRRQQCASGVAALQEQDSSITSLRDVSLPFLEQNRQRMPALTYQRCGYVVRENDRVLAACAALLRNDLAAVGELMLQSHAGLRDEYEVSCRELDILVELAAPAPGFLGGRMMGAGFGGCTLNLVETQHVEEFLQKVAADYKQATGRAARTHVVQIQAGTDCVRTPF